MGAIIKTIDNKIEVEYGDYSGIETSNGIAPFKKTYQKSNIEISLRDDGVVEAHINHLSQVIPLSFNLTATTFKIDMVNNTEPTSNAHLYELIKAII